MGTKLHATERERREWTCPSCGSLISAGDRFQFLVEYQRYMEAPTGTIEGVGTSQPRFACAECRNLAEQLSTAPPDRGGWAIWVAVAFVPLLMGILILGLIATWLV